MKLEPLIEELREAMEQGSGCADRKVVAFCGNLLRLYPALWLFAGIEGVEPTNNHVERILRLVERMLRMVQTLRLQKRSVQSFLEELVIAHRLGTPALTLLVLN
ncbi:MAG: hypothetical protein ABI353_07890 [Isosphaeraceae bacterium]